jgi:nucleotide-binding universal stress UspA family protein
VGAGRDHSGSIGANAQENLLSQLSTEDEARSRAARDSGRVFLNGLRERALAVGVSTVDTRQRHGDLEETLTEQQNDVRLFVLGRRGASADNTQRDLGRHVEWVVRALQRPILVVTEGFKAPERVLIAFDGSSITRKGVEMVAASPLFQGLPIHIVMAGKPSQDGPKQMAWARTKLEAAGFGVVTDIVAGDPETVVGETVRSKGIDLLMMGAYTHSPLRSLVMGSKTADLLRSARIPTLLLR